MIGLARGSATGRARALPCPAGPRLVNATGRGFMRRVLRVLGFSPPVGEFAGEVSAAPLGVGRWALLLSGAAWRAPPHPALRDPAPPGARKCVTSAVPRQGPFFLIAPCKFLGLPAAKLLSRASPPPPGVAEAAGFNDVIFPAARPGAPLPLGSACEMSTLSGLEQGVPGALLFILL